MEYANVLRFSVGEKQEIREIVLNVSQAMHVIEFKSIDTIAE